MAKLAKRRIIGKPQRFYLFDVLSDYAVELVDGKSDFGTLEHAKKRAKKDNKGVVIFWSKKTKLPGESWWGFNVHGEMINVIATRKSNPMQKDYEVLPITKVKNGDVLIEHGGLFRVFNRKVSKAHKPDKYGDTVYFESEYLGPYRSGTVSIPAHWRTKDRPWIVQGNKLRDAVRIKDKKKVAQLRFAKAKKNPVKPGEAPYKHKGIEIWNMGGRHWAYRKPRTDNYIGQFKTVAAAMKAIDKLKPGKNPVKKTTAKQWYRFGWNDARGGAVGNAPKNATHRKYYKEGFKDYPSKDKYKKNPAIEIDELIIFTENESKLHNQFISIMKNLSRKYKKGTYNPVLAAKLWKYWIDEGVIEYNVQFGSGKRTLRQSIFTVDDRKKAAVLIEAQQRGDVATGEYLLINPKGRKMAKKRRSAKQLANDKRLGRMAKARATKKRGGRRKVTKRKTRRNPQKARPGLKKSHLWIIARCTGLTRVAFYAMPIWVTDKGKATRFTTQSAASTAVNYLIKRRLAGNTATAHFVIASSDTTKAEIIRVCQGKV